MSSYNAINGVPVQPGESKTLTLAVPIASLGWYDVAMHDFRVEPGTFDVMVGSSSDDIRLRGMVQVAGQAKRSHAR